MSIFWLVVLCWTLGNDLAAVRSTLVSKPKLIGFGLKNKLQMHYTCCSMTASLHIAAEVDQLVETTPRDTTHEQLFHFNLSNPVSLRIINRC